MSMRRNFKRINGIKGFNMIELLVSLVVVAVSLFAVAKIQITGMQSVEGAKQTTGSTVSIANIIERLSGHRDGIRAILGNSGNGSANFFLDKVDALSDVSGCDAVPSADEASSSDKAIKGLKCEIDAWVYSIYNALNLSDAEDICANITITDVSGTSGYSYKTGFKYSVPMVRVEYKWKKAPSVDSSKLKCTVTDNKLAQPQYSHDPAVDETAEIGYSSMEYLLP